MINLFLHRTQECGLQLGTKDRLLQTLVTHWKKSMKTKKTLFACEQSRKCGRDYTLSKYLLHRKNNIYYLNPKDFSCINFGSNLKFSKILMVRNQGVCVRAESLLSCYTLPKLIVNLFYALKIFENPDLMGLLKIVVKHNSLLFVFSYEL